MGHEVTGIDLSASLLEKAKHDAENLWLEIDFFHGDAENLSFEGSSFDLVVSKFLLWTLPNLLVRLVNGRESLNQKAGFLP
jgi:ubiquinone/menaquinone biosynthesis C-methylase UbiE